MKVRVRKTEVNYKGILCLALFGSLIITFFLYNSTLYSNATYFAYASYILELVCFLLYISSKRLVVKKSNLCLIFIFICGQFIAYLYSKKMGMNFGLNIHNVAMWSIMFLVFLDGASHYSNQLDKANLELFIKCIVWIGIIAGIYNIINNLSNIMSMIVNRYYNIGLRAKFTSFFQTKSTYGYISFFMSTAALYLWRAYGKSRYLWLFFFFLGNVMLGTARGPMIAILLALFAFMLLDRGENSIWLKVMAVLASILVIFTLRKIIANDQAYIFFFTHGSTEDYSSGRMVAWQDFFHNVNPVEFVFGYGMGAQNILPGLFTPNFEFGSYHNMYVDLICEGGIIMLFIEFYAILFTLIRVIKSSIGRKEKIYFIVTIVGFLELSLTDSLGSLFDVQQLSMVATLYVIAIPNAFLNGENRNEKNIMCSE